MLGVLMLVWKREGGECSGTRIVSTLVVHNQIQSTANIPVHLILFPAFILSSKPPTSHLLHLAGADIVKPNGLGF